MTNCVKVPIEEYAAMQAKLKEQSERIEILAAENQALQLYRPARPAPKDLTRPKQLAETNFAFYGISLDIEPEAPNVGLDES